MPVYDAWEQVVGETLVFSPVLRALEQSGMRGWGTKTDYCITPDTAPNAHASRDSSPNANVTSKSESEMGSNSNPNNNWDAASFVVAVQCWLMSERRLMEVCSAKILTHAYFVEVDSQNRITKVLISV